MNIVDRSRGLNPSKNWWFSKNLEYRYFDISILISIYRLLFDTSLTIQHVPTLSPNPETHPSPYPYPNTLPRVTRISRAGHGSFPVARCASCAGRNLHNLKPLHSLSSPTVPHYKHYMRGVHMATQSGNGDRQATGAEKCA